MRTTELSLVTLAMLCTGAICAAAATITDAAELAQKHQPFGIEKRVLWTTSRVVGSPNPPLPYTAKPTFTKIKFKQPLYLENEPGTDRVFVVQQNGHILSFQNDPDVEKSEVFLDMKQQAYGLTFHPDYAKNGYLYVVSNGANAAAGGKKNDRVSRFSVDRKPPFACDPKTELVIIEWPSDGHNGGDLAFGPDGYLYVPAGDGTTDSDTNLAGQDVGNVNATLMRIDVERADGKRNYSVPDDNPFVGKEGVRPEIWAYGFRNPWRLTFDAKTGHLWVGNIGQDQWEMIHLVRRGENYGWSVMEGGHPFYLERKLGPSKPVKPTIEHAHSEARSITGGIVYYGAKFPKLNGAYIYGDYSTGKIWAARHDGKRLTFHREIADTFIQILGFAVDHQGEILIVDYGGAIFRLEHAPKAKPQPKFPTRLSETGLFTSVRDHQTDPALIPYSVNAPLWSDNAYKERFIALPGESLIKFTTNRGWEFSDGSVLVKTFSLELEHGKPESRRRIETRLLTRQLGEWAGYSYVWNDQQTDAELVRMQGTDRSFTIKDPSAAGGSRKQTWHYPSRAECMVCHTRAAKYVLGLTELQMNKVHDYGEVSDEQLRTLEHLGLFGFDLPDHERELTKRFNLVIDATNRETLAPLERLSAMSKRPLAAAKFIRRLLAVIVPSQFRAAYQQWMAALPAVRRVLSEKLRKTKLLPKRPSEYRRLVNPYDPAKQLDARARSYLHANCSICHVAAGGGNAQMEIEFTTPAAKTKIFNVTPVHHKFGIDNAKLIAPGAPERSVILQRISRRGRGQMPPLASSLVDERAVALLREWIKQMKPVKVTK